MRKGKGKIGKNSQCLGYEQKVCWRPRIREFCATCQITYDIHNIEHLIASISTLTDDEAFIHATAQPITDMLSKFTKLPLLDNLLLAMYRKKSLLGRYITHITQSPLNAALQIRIMSHTEVLCPVYSWMVRNTVTNTILPSSCLRCFGSNVLYMNYERHRHHIEDILFNMDLNIPSLILPGLISQVIDDDGHRVADFVKAAYEGGYKISHLMNYLARKYPKKMDSIQAAMTFHPYRIANILYSDDKELKKLIYSYLKARTNLFKEELIVKTWHPHRLFPWCLDIQDIEDMSVNFSG